MDAETQDSYSKIPWKTVIIVFSILIVLTIGYIQVFPQYSSRFLISIVIAIIIGFVFLAIFVLNKKWRVKFREYILNYQTKAQRPSSSRYRKAQIFFLAMFVSFTILGLVLANNLTLIHNQYVQYMFLAFLVAFFVSFIIYISYLLKTFWKWGECAARYFRLSRPSSQIFALSRTKIHTTHLSTEKPCVREGDFDCLLVEPLLT